MQSCNFESSDRSGFDVNAQVCDQGNLCGSITVHVSCYDEAEAKALCFSTSDCGGINKQHSECGGTQWTLRSGTTPTAAAGNDASKLECQLLDRNCEAEEGPEAADDSARLGIPPGAGVAHVCPACAYALCDGCAGWDPEPMSSLWA